MSNLRLFFEISFYQEQERERFPRRRDGSCISELFGSNYLPPLPSLSKSDGQWQTTAVYRKMGSNSLSFCFYTFFSHKCYTTTISDANCLTVTMYIICGKAGHANLRKNGGVQKPKAKDGDIKRTTTVCMPHALRTVNCNVLSRGRIKCVYTSSAY